MELKPVLLFGMPRSGTTWLGKVFDSHPATLYRHEPDSGGALDGFLPLLPDPAEHARWHEPLQAFVEHLPYERSLKVTGKLPVFRKAYQPPLARPLRHALLVAAKACSRLRPVPAVPEFVRRHHDGQVYLVWKSIESLGRVGVLARTLPDARVVHIVRHPCGYVSSVLNGEAAGWMPGARASSEDYGIFERLLETPSARRRGLTRAELERLSPEQRLAWRWLLYNEKALEDLQGLEHATTVLYEDLCADPEAGYRNLFDFAGLDWDSQTAMFVRASTHSESTSYFSVFKNPARAAGSWREQLSARVQNEVLDVVAHSRAGALYGV